MKRIHLTSILILYVLFAISQQISCEVSDRAQRFYVSLEQLSEVFENPDMLYAPFMFWFWDEPLNIGRMEEMAEKMISQGINPIPSGLIGPVMISKYTMQYRVNQGNLIS